MIFPASIFRLRFLIVYTYVEMIRTSFRCIAMPNDAFSLGDSNEEKVHIDLFTYPVPYILSPNKLSSRHRKDSGALRWPVVVCEFVGLSGNNLIGYPHTKSGIH